MKRSTVDIATDRILLFFSIAIIGLMIASGHSDEIGTMVSCACVFVASLLIPRLAERTNNFPVRVLYFLYIMPALFLVYPGAMALARSLNPNDFDPQFIAIDRFLFLGNDPTLWMAGHLHPSRLLVDVLQVCYASHYLFALILGVELAINRKVKELEGLRMLMVYGAIMSFIINILLPAVGPRITLREFANLGNELPGLWVTDWIRGRINNGEGLRATMTSVEAFKAVYRDAFPSGHTMFTVMTLIVGFRCKARVRWFILVLGCGLIAATLILHYHYVIDVIGGIAFAWFAAWSAPAFANWIGSLGWKRSRTT